MFERLRSHRYGDSRGARTASCPAASDGHTAIAAEGITVDAQFVTDVDVPPLGSTSLRIDYP